MRSIRPRSLKRSPGPRSSVMGSERASGSPSPRPAPGPAGTEGDLEAHPPAVTFLGLEPEKQVQVGQERAGLSREHLGGRGRDELAMGRQDLLAQLAQA